MTEFSCSALTKMKEQSSKMGASVKCLISSLYVLVIRVICVY